MMGLQIIEDWIEFDGVRVARLLPNLTPTLLDRLDLKLEEIGIDYDDMMSYLDDLDEKVEQLMEKSNGKNPRAKSLAERMLKARMRIVAAMPKEK